MLTVILSGTIQNSKVCAAPYGFVPLRIFAILLLEDGIEHVPVESSDR